MGRALTWLAALCAVLPSALPRDLAAVLDGRARVALALVPWLFLAGLPRAAARSWGTALGLALPTVALAAWLDLRAGTDAGALATRVGWAAACAAPAWVAAERARRAPGYAVVWFVAWVLVPLTALFTIVLDPSAAPATDSLRLAASPATRALAVATDLRASGLDALSVVASLGLLAVALFARSRLESNPRGA